MTLSDRLKNIASHYGLTVRDFERRANLANGYVRTIGNGIGSNKLESILTAFPEISRVWLLTGEGNMLINSTGIEEKPTVPEAAPAPAPGGDLTSRLLAIVESQQQTIAQQAAVIAENTAVLKSVKEELAESRSLREQALYKGASGSPSSIDVPSPVSSIG